MIVFVSPFFETWRGYQWIHSILGRDEGMTKKIQRHFKKAWQREEITISYLINLSYWRVFFLLENKLCSFLQVKCLRVMQERHSLHTKKFFTRFRSLAFILGQPVVNVAPHWRSKDSRREWETAFSNSVVAPVLTVCELYLIVILQLIMISFWRFWIFLFDSHFLRTSRERSKITWKWWLETID